MSFSSRLLANASVAAVYLMAAGSLTAAEPPIELVVRGDDMGWAYDVNLAFAKEHTDGIVTSASIMPTSLFYPEAVEVCKAHPKLAVGIHLTLMAISPLRPVLPPDQVRSLVAGDGCFHRCLDDFMKAEPKIEEIEKELRAQIAKVQASGLRVVYLDWHIAPPEGWPRRDITDLIDQLASEHRFLVTQDPDGRRAGAKLVHLNLESWSSRRMDDGTVVYWSRPHLPEETKAAFYETLRTLKPGTWWTLVHPGQFCVQQKEAMELLCSDEAKRIIAERHIRLISYEDLWRRKFGEAGSKPEPIR